MLSVSVYSSFVSGNWENDWSLWCVWTMSCPVLPSSYLIALGHEDGMVLLYRFSLVSGEWAPLGRVADEYPYMHAAAEWESDRVCVCVNRQ